MKKMHLFLIIIVMLCFAGAGLFFLWPRVHLEGESGATLRYNNGTGIVTINPSEDEIKALKILVSGRILYRDNPSCGFAEDFSFCIGDRVFFVAKDECGIILDCQSNYYFSISEEDRRWIDSLFAKYGATNNYY